MHSLDWNIVYSLTFLLKKLPQKCKLPKCICSGQMSYQHHLSSSYYNLLMKLEFYERISILCYIQLILLIVGLSFVHAYCLALHILYSVKNYIQLFHKWFIFVNFILNSFVKFRCFFKFFFIAKYIDILFKRNLCCFSLTVRSISECSMY